VPRTLSIGNDEGACCDTARDCRRVVRRELGCIVGIGRHSQMKIVASTILCVRDPNVGFGEGGIEVQSFGSRFRAGNHSADTRSAVTSESARLLVQSNKRSERSAMNDEPDGRIIVPAADDPGGHHDARFAREPRLQLRLLSVLVEMGMKVSGPIHIIWPLRLVRTQAGGCLTAKKPS
jgi:hypothetical protein